MFKRKSYNLYNTFQTSFKKPLKSVSNPSETFFSNNRSYIFQSSTKQSTNNFPFINSYNLKPNSKRAKSFKQSVDYKFYKLIKKSPLTTKNSKRRKNFYYPEIVSKSPFNFDFKTDDEMLKRIKLINKGNKKHKILSAIASKREIEKRKKALKFLHEMKLRKINIRLIKKKVIEEKKIMVSEFNNSQRKNKKNIFRLKKISFEHPQTTKNLYRNNSESVFSFNKLINNERKMVFKKDKLMHRFHEIMHKLNSQSENNKNNNN